MATTELDALSAALFRPDDPGRNAGGEGMSPAELKGFLCDWSDEDRQKRTTAILTAGAPSGEDEGASVLLGALVRDLAPEGRERAIARLLGTIGSLYRRCGISLPSWFTDAAETFSDPFAR